MGGEKMFAIYATTERSARIGRFTPVVAAVILIAMLLTACNPVRPSAPTASHDAETATAWFDLALRLVKETPGFSPPVAARAYGYLGVALYETVQPGMDGYRSLAGMLNELETLPTPDPHARYDWSVAANSALATLMRQLFPTATPENLAAIDELEQKLAQGFGEGLDAATFMRSQAWGRSVAEAIYAWSMTDGGHEGYMRNFPTEYAPPVGPGLWISTPSQFASALQPYWGENRPFVSAPEACPAPPPPAYSEEPGSPMYAEALEVYKVGMQRTPEQIEIALFWADDPGRTATPSGHWISILGQVLDEGNHTLDMAAEAYARVGMAVADAFITCWKTKFDYNLLRPITYIQQIIDPTWNAEQITDPVVTPPFPEYTSGHSVQSAAAATVLTALFGEEYAFTDNTHAELGLAPRSFPSFRAAAEEAAISRLYGGIHYRVAIENGLMQGDCIAANILSLSFREE
jgi:hypothetical protein